MFWTIYARFFIYHHTILLVLVPIPARLRLESAFVKAQCSSIFKSSSRWQSTGGNSILPRSCSIKRSLIQHCASLKTEQRIKGRQRDGQSTKLCVGVLRLLPPSRSSPRDMGKIHFAGSLARGWFTSSIVDGEGWKWVKSLNAGIKYCDRFDRCVYGPISSWKLRELVDNAWEILSTWAWIL